MPHLPFDVVEHILSFLESHPKALLACSKAHPILSQIVEKYWFRHITLRTGFTNFTFSFTPSDMLRCLTETPRIVNYVAILEVEFIYDQDRDWMTPYLKEIASLLPMFPLLECIMLPSRRNDSALLWRDLPQNFRTAVENCLHLPTLQEVHVGDMSFPLSTLDNHANINYLSLAGPPEIEPLHLEITHPQIKSLALEGFQLHDSEVFRTWAKRHILELRRLKYDFSCPEIILEVFKICGDTLEILYLYLHREGILRGSSSRLAQVWRSIAEFPETESSDLVDLSSLPRLRHLTIQIYFEWHNSGETMRTTYLGTAIKILKTASSLKQVQLTICIEIYVDPFESDANWEQIDDIDFSPLTFLTESLVCFPHVDLYIYTAKLRFTYAKMDSLLAKYEGLVKLIEQGVLVIHPDETAPTLSPRSYVAKDIPKCIIM